MAAEPDAELLARFVEGDGDAFEALFRDFEVEVYRWAMRIVRDRGAAEDVVIETFWRAYRARARFEWSRSFGAWLRRIATNAALDRLRSVRRQRDYAPLFDTAQLALAPHGLPDVIAVAFRKLPPKLYAVAMLALVEQLSHAEIADALGVPLGTVKSRLHRALQTLRRELRAQGIES
jgi:RNA polymerase sigma-70 factor (ECF subfamily)